MSNYKLTVKRTPFEPTPNDLLPKLYFWNLYRIDNTIGYTAHGRTYTKLGAILKAKYLLWKNKRQSLWKETEIQL